MSYVMQELELRSILQQIKPAEQRANDLWNKSRTLHVGLQPG